MKRKTTTLSIDKSTEQRKKTNSNTEGLSSILSLKQIEFTQ